MAQNVLATSCEERSKHKDSGVVGWRYVFFIFFIFTLSPGTSALLQAEVKTANVLADHMVLQRSMPVHLWGTADPGERVTAQFRGSEAVGETDSLGRWSLYLPPGSAGGPFALTIRGSNTISWKDVLVGDVWIASGQSNMEFPIKMSPPWTSALKNMDAEVAAVNHPDIRLMVIKKEVSDYPRHDANVVSWSVCTPESAAAFSAVAYFFGKELEQEEHVPIGLVQAAWGGTPAEAWTSMDGLTRDAALMPTFRARSMMLEDRETQLLQIDKEKKDAAIAKQQGKKPWLPWHPDLEAWAPGVLFNAMISPLTSMSIRGVIWYQGESNTTADMAPFYARLFPAMIQDWRAKWKQENFPFLFVQIANYNSRDEWPEVREAQRKTLSLSNTGMAVTIDIGDPKNIHPSNKQDVGHRLALLARSISYGEKIEDSGPLFRQAVPEGAQMRIWFDDASDGLVAKGGRLTGFEVADASGKYFAADAKIDGQSVVASSSQVAHPVSVRYGWASNPECNLTNRADLPASPFRSAQ